jgi:hypothetical protein
MVLVPLPVPEANPAALIVATPTVLDDQETWLVMSSVWDG